MLLFQDEEVEGFQETVMEYVANVTSIVRDTEENLIGARSSDQSVAIDHEDQPPQMIEA